MKDNAAERMKSIAYRWIEEGWQKGNAGIVDELHSPGFVDRDPSGRRPDLEGFKEGIVQLYAAFPDFHGVIEDLIVDAASGKAALRWTATGTHRGTFLGVRPSGKRISFKGIEIIRIEEARIVERWGEWDGTDLLEQLGATAH
jgi:steroid delta-isomerase-like uncharacterized protein